MQGLIDLVKDNWVAITVVFLAFNTFLKAVRDAIDKTPATDDNLFEKFCTLIGKIGGYLFTGKRA